MALSSGTWRDLPRPYVNATFPCRRAGSSRFHVLGSALPVASSSWSCRCSSSSRDSHWGVMGSCHSRGRPRSLPLARRRPDEQSDQAAASAGCGGGATGRRFAKSFGTHVGPFSSGLGWVMRLGCSQRLGCVVITADGVRTPTRWTHDLDPNKWINQERGARDLLGVVQEKSQRPDAGVDRGAGGDSVRVGSPGVTLGAPRDPEGIGDPPSRTDAPLLLPPPRSWLDAPPRGLAG
jgi:hypothetical protein